jgi:hypothetical protein
MRRYFLQLMTAINELRNISITDETNWILNEEVSISPPLGEQVYLISSGESGSGVENCAFAGINFGLARDR